MFCTISTPTSESRTCIRDNSELYVSVNRKLSLAIRATIDSCRLGGHGTAPFAREINTQGHSRYEIGADGMIQIHTDTTCCTLAAAGTTPASEEEPPQSHLF